MPSPVPFAQRVLNWFDQHGRKDLPWQRDRTPYRVWISEIMLQQTQVDRVVPYYARFLKQFPTVRALAGAPLSDVIKSWQGLGYNRRAKMLHSAAKDIVVKHKGIFPRGFDALLALPGIGPYTASAVRVFAFNEPDTLIETNVRTVLLHHFFPRKRKVQDKELLQLVVVPKGTEPREWYAALMDYGSHLKKKVPNPSRRSAHHVRQKPFKGSDREIRGAIIRRLSERSSSIEGLFALPFGSERIRIQLARLQEEKLISRRRGRFVLSG